MTILPYICNYIMGFVSNRVKTFRLQMVFQAPTSVIASSNYYLGPLDQKPSIWGLGEHVASTIEGWCPSTAGSSYGIRTMPLSLFNIIFLKEKGEMRESLPRQVDKKSRVLKEKRVWGSWGGDRGLEFSRRRKRQTSFYLFIFFSTLLSHVKLFCLFLFYFKPGTDDYTINNSV